MPDALRAEAAGASPPAPAASPSPGLRIGPEVYQSIGVRPLINARGTYTILSGSTMLPEVRAAMDAAARHYVHLDELTEAIAGRLAALTGAEWGIVTSGCAAALTHATAACVAGGNPDLHVRIPNLSGFAKDEAIIPKHSRNVYDAALRAVGVRVIEVTTPAEGRRRLLTTPFRVFEEHVKVQLDQALRGAGFDAGRDIRAITVNRWPHGYAYSPGLLWEPEWKSEAEKPWVVGRQPFGRIAIANSDAGARADTNSAIKQAFRAVQESLNG
jgi:hypothetical protein